MPTPGQRKGNQVPGRLQCSICQTYKNTANFSKNELKNLQWSNGRNARLRCTACTGQQRHELECLKCGDVLEISKFSKTSKKAGGNQWCIECTMYKESAIPDSEQTEVVSRAVTYSSDYQDFGGNAASDMTASSAVMGRTSFAQPPSFARTPGTDSFEDGISRLRAMKLAGPASGESLPNIPDFIPPHLRANSGGPAVNASVSSASNIYEDAETSATPSVAPTEDEDDGWNTVAPQRRQFHAYDPQGQHHLRVTSGPSSAVNTRLSSANTPTPTPPPASAPSSGRAGNWARPVGRTERVTHTGFSAPERREYNNQYDSDDSFDEP